MPQRNVATNFTFEQQRAEINLLAQDFWTQKGTVDTAASTYLKHDGSNNFTGATLAVPNAFTINPNSGGGTVTIAGNLDVTGTTTTVSSANLEVTDKNILISKGSTTDAQADGAGITIDSGTDITWNFVDAKDAWVSSIGVESTTFLKATTYLEAARGQFTGSTSPTAGSGVEVNAPDTNTGQIIAYNRGTSAYNELRLRAASVPIYTGTTNAIVGTFNSTGLTMESGKGITCPGDLDVDGTSYFGASGSITAGANFVLSSNKFRVTGSDTVGIECQRAGNATIQCTDTTNSTDLQLRANSDGGLVRTATEKPLIFGTFQNERLRISSSGRVAIGNATNNASPTALLGVIADDGEAANVYIAKFHNLEATTGESFGVNIQAGSSADDHGLRVKNRANNTTQFIVQGDGKIGLGEDSPTYQTEIKVSVTDAYSASTLNSGQHQLRVNNAGAEGVAGILLTAEPSSGSAGHAGIRVIAPANGSADMTFSTRNAGTYGEKLRITAAGDIKIPGGAYLDFYGSRTTYRHTGSYGEFLNPTGDFYVGVGNDYKLGNGDFSVEYLTILNGTGHVLPGADNTQDLGSTTKRWANVYTGDLNLCNEGSYNEVDGTSGSWTMQEGNSDLFLINRKSGKKYKFNLTEVS